MQGLLSSLVLYYIRFISRPSAMLALSFFTLPRCQLAECPLLSTRIVMSLW